MQALREQESLDSAKRRSLGPASSSGRAEAISYSLWSYDWWACPAPMQGMHTKRAAWHSMLAAMQTSACRRNMQDFACIPVSKSLIHGMPASSSAGRHTICCRCVTATIASHRTTAHRQCLLQVSVRCSLKYEDTICDGVYDLRGRFTDLQPGSPEQFPSLEELQMFIPGPLDDREVRPPICLWPLHWPHCACSGHECACSGHE